MDLVPSTVTAAAVATVEAVAVADITNPSELGSIAGSVAGERRVVYQADAADDVFTTYFWDSADSSGASSPYVVAGSSGFWIAAGGRYTNSAVGIRGDVSVRALSASAASVITAGGTFAAASASEILRVLRGTSAGTSAAVSIGSGNTGTAAIYLGDTDSIIDGGVEYDNNTRTLAFRAGGSSSRLSLTSSSATFHSSVPVAVSNTTSSTNTTTGCATFAGGIGVAGNFYVGASSTVGASTSTLQMVVSNSGALTNSFARVQVKADSAPTLQMDAFASTYTGAAWGITLANYQTLSVSSGTSNGLIIGHLSNKPVIFGVSTIEVARFTGGTIGTDSLAVKYTAASTSPTTGSATFAGGVGVSGRSFFGSGVYSNHAEGFNVEDTATADGGRPFGFIRSSGGSVNIGHANRASGLPTSSATRLSIDSTGYVHIGTSVPAQAYQLDVRCGAAADSIRFGNASSDSGIYFSRYGGDAEMGLATGAHYTSFSSPNYVLTAKSTNKAGHAMINGVHYLWTETSTAPAGTFNLPTTQFALSGTALTVGVATSLTSTTASTSTATGALVVSGGLGIAGAVFTGGSVTITHTDDAAGGLILRTSTTDATAKNGRIKIQHYTNAEEPVTALLGIAGNGFNQLSWGGSSGVENAATVHVFYTAATSTTLTGTERMRIDSTGNVSIGTAALATTATDGFFYIPTCAGAPTGVPTAKTGRSPIIYDSTNNKLYVYNGAWKATAALT